MTLRYSTRHSKIEKVVNVDYGKGELIFTSGGENNWNKYIDGIADEEYFEMLPFTG